MNDLLKALADKINDETKWHEEYNTDNTDCGPAEASATNYYGDGELYYGNLEGSAKEIQELMSESGFDKESDKFLVDNCSPEYEPSIRSVSNSIQSVEVSELEVQLSDEVAEEIDKLSAEEYKLLSSMVEAHLPKQMKGFAYLSVGGFWHGVVNSEEYISDCINFLERNGSTKELIKCLLVLFDNGDIDADEMADKLRYI